MGARQLHRQQMESMREAETGANATSQEEGGATEDAGFRKRAFLWWRSYGIEFRELVFFLVFLVVYMAVSFGPSGTTMDRYQLKADLGSNVHPKFSLLVTSKAAWYDYMEGTLLPNLYWSEWAVNAPASSVKGASQFTADGVNRRIGSVRVRLIRVQDFAATRLPEAYADVVEHLFPKLDYDSNLETLDYNVSGLRTLKWETGAALGNRGETLCGATTRFAYPPSGYVLDFPDGLANATSLARELRSHGLIDLATRAVMVDYNVYNANTDEVGVVSLVTQFLATGGVVPEPKVAVQPLLATYRVLTGDSPSFIWSFLTFLEVTLYAVVMALLAREYTTYKAIGSEKFFADSFVRVDLMNYALFMVVLCLRVNIVANLWYLSDELKGDDGLSFVNLSRASVAYGWGEAISAFNAIITFLKVFKYVRPVKKLALFTETLALASVDMGYMCVVLCVIFLAFGTAFNLGFGADVKAYVQLPDALLALFKAMLGDMDLDTLVASNYVLGPFLFVLFIFLVFFVLLSMFLSIVDESFDIVRSALDDKEHEAEPLERDLRRFGSEVKALVLRVATAVTGLKVQEEGAKVAPGPPESDPASGVVEGGVSSTAVVALAAGQGLMQPAGNADEEFVRRRNEVSSEASPVALELAGAFAQLNTLAEQQAEMVALLGVLDDRVMKRRKVVKRLSDQAGEAKSTRRGSLESFKE